ncbi:uncharacterized protein [Physcomitrium patens]|uniref:Xaa-Pro dipeptidase n=1 Tax=Physcomitrium patens TaxID=3218 RepID=A9SEP6_PHYPA|nr:xaa-Pro dipeptidase-like [Physcomitrium patens]XP_024361459.1 xaa-Pro dipeptidase-like [Physcomitrium patens]|eukprot:XP_024361458.1 xaa-Pro dipeptidase-like [Physcomitrella patens]
MEVSMELHAVNRKKLLSRMSDQVKSMGQPVNGVILLQGGDECTRYCTDHTPLFRQESYFAYLFGVKEPGFFGTLDLSNGKSALYCPRLDPEYAVWLGEIQPPSHFKDLYGVDEVHYVDELVEVLNKSRAGVSSWLLYLLYGKNSDSGNFSQPAQFEGIEDFAVDKEVLHPVLSECRVHKSKLEIDLMRYVCKVSSAAHIQVMQECKPGMREYQLEAIFLHHVYRYGGCRHCSYTCICATGTNSSVLHYGHAAAPNDRLLENGDMALLDMGAEYHFYGSDITCSFPVNGTFTDNQKVVYTAVLKAQNAVIRAIRPGVSWVDLHKLAESCILETLKENGVLQGDVQAMMESRLGAIFMPHGLGHFLGLDTHDTGGYPAGTERINSPGLKSLRTVRILEEGMVVTVEPGCYFIEALLVPALEDPAQRNFFVEPALEVFRHTGGVRLEDDILVTANGCENLTICPREIEDVEAVMKGSWPM